MNSTVWIIAPVYNVEKLLGKCVKSIQRQTYKSWKLVLVDDGSTDSSGKLCDKFASNDNRISVVHTENCGLSGARRNGLRQIPDDGYCCFCDSDDTLPRNAIETMYNEAVKSGADIVCGQFQRLIKGIKIKPSTQPPCFRTPKCYTHEEVMSNLYVSCFGITDFPVNLCGKIFNIAKLKKIMLDPVPIPKYFAEDMDVILRLLPKIDKVSVIDNIIYNYRIGGGTTKFMPFFLNDSILIYERKKEYAGYYTGNADLQQLTAIDFKNVIMTHLIMCERFKRFPKGSLKEEFEFILSLPQFNETRALLGNTAEEKAFFNGDFDQIEAIVKERAVTINRREKIKKFLLG